MNFMPSSDVKPIYVLHGDDEFLKDQNRRQVVAQIIGQTDPQLCVSTFDATVELATVMDELRTLPFLAPHRVVIVREADAFIAANREALERYCDAPCRTATLLLIVSAWNSAHRIAKAVARIGQAIDCSVSDREAMAPRLNRLAEALGKKLAPDAARALEDMVGRDLASLSSEVDKLAAYVGNKPLITAADVNAVVIAASEPVDFALPNALTAAKVGDALVAMHAVMTRKGEEFRTLGAIASHLRRAMKGHALKASGQDPATVLPFNMPFRAKNDFLAMLGRRPLAKFQADFRRMIAADLAMKSGADPLAAMQELVVALCL